MSENVKKDTEKKSEKKSYIYFDKNGVVSTTNKKYFIKDN